MGYRVERLEASGRDAWNRFVEESNEGTLFHRLDFLDYHGDRFSDQEHHLVARKGEALFALMPMAIVDRDGKRTALSPYGGSVGGPCARDRLRYHEIHDLLDAMFAYLREISVDELVMTPPIAPCHAAYSETARFALEQRGGRLVRRLLCSVADLQAGDSVEENLSVRARRALRRAERSGVTTKLRGDLTDFWKLMDLTFEKHGSRPTHSFDEFAWLSRELPERVWANVAYLEGEPAAGVGCFRINQRVLGSFYLCGDPRHRQSQALTRLVVETMEEARRCGIRWFDLGTTSRPQGFMFKEGFGTRGFFRETLRLPMNGVETPWQEIVGAPEQLAGTGR